MNFKLLTAFGLTFALNASLAKSAEVETLKTAYGKLFAIGAAIPGPNLSEAEQTLLRTNFTTVTPENCMKPGATEPSEGVFTFEKADALVAFAQKNRLTVNGHTLLWHENCPDWFFLDGDKPAGRELVLKRMRNHIKTQAAHFRGKVASWDVVNEAMGGGGDYLRKTKWLECIGADYIAEAYIAAHEGDPEAELYYNDYGIEYPEKRERTLRLIRELKARNVRLDGVGIQGHWEIDKIPYQNIEDSIIAFHAEGLKVMITELDMDVVSRAASGADAGQKEKGGEDPFANGCTQEVLQKQADQYRDLFALFRRHADKITRVTFWGLHDGRSWLNTWPRKRTNHPLLWGRNLLPKPAFTAVISNDS